MKLLKTVLFTSIFLFSTTTTNAQLFKKLKEKAKQKIEQEAERRTQKRIDEKIDDAFNEAEETIDGKNKNKTSDEVNLPASYQFEWKYVLKMESKKAKGDMKMIYFLNANSTAFATKFEIADKDAVTGNMLTILDPTTGANVMLMDVDGNKMRQNMPSFSSDAIDEATQEQVANDYTVVKTDTKTILGYHCQGFKITSSDGIANMYIAQNAPVSFNNSMSGNAEFKPKGFDPKLFENFEKGLMMEMQFTSNKKEKYNMKMTCVELVKEPLTINMNEYKSFGF